MESNIKNAKFTIFNSKEEYLNMREAWKRFHREGHAKGIWTETTHKVHDWRTNTVTEHINKTKHAPLSGMHYILYNLLRGKPAHSGFMQDWTHPTDGYANYYCSLESQLEEATKPLIFSEKTTESGKKWAADRQRWAFERLILPFRMVACQEDPLHSTLTEEHLAAVLKLMKEGHYRDLLEDEEEAVA